MKMRKWLAIALAGLFVLGAAGCTDGDPSANLPPTDGDEPWEGNWERPGFTGGEDGEHICWNYCEICGKCISDCDNAVCAEKCYDVGTRTLYTFNATDKRVKREGGVTIEGDHVGNISLNPNVVLTYKIVAVADTTACLGATISEMGEAHYIAGETPIYVNGERVTSTAVSPAGGSFWTNFRTIWLGCIQLKEGENIIEFTNTNDSNTRFNFKDFSFLSPVELTWVSAVTSHVCTSANEEGLCTDYTCNELGCLEKDTSGWQTYEIYGGDEKVLKYYLNGGVMKSLWIENEDCIGNIANSLIVGVYDQTIIWSFEASGVGEDTWIGLSLNTSTSSGGVSYETMFDLFFNGEAISTDASTATVSGGGWTTYAESIVAFVHVKEGVNTFKMVHKRVNAGDNIRSLKLTFPKGTFTTVQAETDVKIHTCGHKNAAGKCTDYTCNEYGCLDKEMTGWQSYTIDGGDDNVLKYYFDGEGNEHSLWNPSENTIGYLANGSMFDVHDQTVIWSFEATGVGEDTWVCLSISTGTYFGGASFADMYDFTFNGEAVTTGAVSGSVDGGGWLVFAEVPLIFVKVKEGVNTFKMMHTSVDAGDNIGSLKLTFPKGTFKAVQATKS